MNGPPLPDEFEVTLLGRGVGECVVVHLGDQQWMIVDSFMDGSEPAGLKYLESIDVSEDQVVELVVTHFHSDHYRGIDLLHARCRNATLGTTRALRADQFVPLYAYEDEDGELQMLAGVIGRALERQVVPNIPAHRDLKVGQLVHDGPKSVVRALSPTEAAVHASCTELAEAWHANDLGRVRSRLRNDNRSSVVLHITAGASAILLGGDLENGPAGFGWQVVLDEPLHQNLMPSSLIKVPHHGSEGADHLPTWESLVTEKPWVLVTPYWPSRLPRAEDVDRLRERARVLYQAAPSVGYTIDEFGNRVSLPAKLGAIQARRRSTDPDWVIHLEGGAFVP